MHPEIFDNSQDDNEPQLEYHYTYHVKMWAYFAHDLTRPIDYSELFIDMSAENPRLPRANDLGEYIANIDEEFVGSLVEDFGCNPEFISIIHDVKPMF